MAPEVSEVFHARSDSCDAFMIERPHLPAIRDLVHQRPNFIRLKPLQVLALSVQHARVWAKELVGGASEEVAVDSSHIDQPVRTVVDRVDECQSSNLVRETNYFLHIIDCADCIGGIAHGDQLGLSCNLAGQMLHVQCAVLFLNVRKANPYSALFE